MARNIKIEGYTPDEILAMPPEALRDFVFLDDAIVFRIGTAEVLGDFRVVNGRLIVELAQIDGGGEGVLPTLVALAKAYARAQTLREIEWVVHAITCAKPNIKLRRVLERRGFEIRTLPGHGEAYYLLEDV